MVKGQSRPRTRKGRRKPKWDENPFPAREWGFKSLHRHQIMPVDIEAPQQSALARGTVG